ncbi:hypothetical protein, partial [Escherichia coli]|uniref:hypothetical protein n=1 Tax=Escherichia coli TaxID=562 RepID=UPI001BAEC9CA
KKKKKKKKKGQRNKIVKEKEEEMREGCKEEVRRGEKAMVKGRRRGVEEQGDKAPYRPSPASCPR